MAKKNTSSRKPVQEPDIPVEEVSDYQRDAPESESHTAAKTETPPSKRDKVKTTEDPASSGNMGLGDIRKAVAFANSVGGLDRAMVLLQIVKVAKEVQ